MFKTLKNNFNIKALTDVPAKKMDNKALQEDIKNYFNYLLGRTKYCRSTHYPYEALVLTIRDRLYQRMRETKYQVDEKNAKRAYYLSMEFLMGRTLGNALLNLGIDEATSQATTALGLELEELFDAEPDAGLGNGGLGRLAACFLDSCASLSLPVVGYGIRYEYGMFNQIIDNGYQIEEPDHWLQHGNPWEQERPEHTRRIKFGGYCQWKAQDGKQIRHWYSTQDVLAIPFDVPIPGYQNDIVNLLRLWKSAATDEFNLNEFNAGSYTEAVETKNAAENITMVLYPNDQSESGKALRLQQQYFLASASLQDIFESWTVRHDKDFSQFADKHCFQLNDTHPTCVVPELMRILLDDYHMSWEYAWDITTKTVAYTNHTLLPEALEKWPVPLFEALLPRILEIIYEINRRFLTTISHKWPGDCERLANMSIIEEGSVKHVRMAYLAIVASFSVNGVAALHSALLKKGLFSDFYNLWPHKFNNKTNGVTQRRWIAHCNPLLSRCLSRHIKGNWLSDLKLLVQIAPHAQNKTFQNEWQKIKQDNKKRLALLVETECGIQFPVDALFDVQVKRIHEYKRQLLNILHVIHCYIRIKEGQTKNWTPRCVLIGGKAAPGYVMAKLIIKLIGNVARIIEEDPQTTGLLHVAFIPNYRVTKMEIICPGTDLSEQISTAGKEASGTGNMKFMMNGAVTIGTLDGANIEILEQVGKENFFLFGLTATEVEEQRHHYNPQAIISSDHRIQKILNLLSSNFFSPLENCLFDPIINALTCPYDPWMTIADLGSYIDTQEKVSQAYQDRPRWLAMSILNTAKSSFFSSDRTIHEYNREIWKLDEVSSSS